MRSDFKKMGFLPESLYQDSWWLYSRDGYEVSFHRRSTLPNGVLPMLSIRYSGSTNSDGVTRQLFTVTGEGRVSQRGYRKNVRSEAARFGVPDIDTVLDAWFGAETGA